MLKLKMSLRVKIVRIAGTQWSLKWADMVNLWHAAISPIAGIRNQLLKKSVLNAQNVKKANYRTKKQEKDECFMDVTKYPECEFVSWDKPLPRECPKCEGLLVEKKLKKVFKFNVSSVITKKNRKVKGRVANVSLFSFCKTALNKSFPKY